MRRLILSLIALAVISGCSKDNNPVNSNGNENVSLSVVTEESAADNSADLTITEAKGLISKIELEKTDGSTITLRDQPFVINFDLSGQLKQSISVNVPEGTYKKIKFQIHKPEDNETPPDPEFKEGNSGNQRYSFIVKGSYNGNSFVFKSRKSDNLVFNLDSDISVSTVSVNITMLINRTKWFGGSGLELDPSDEGNRNQIEDNIKSSFKSFFKDDNRDGRPDNN